MYRQKKCTASESFIQIVQLISPYLLCIIAFCIYRGYTSTWSVTVFGETSLVAHEWRIGLQLQLTYGDLVVIRCNNDDVEGRANTMFG